ncbi:MAG: hypothetical protein DRQ99_14755 [Candidatus Parabeggiatoa sp. nov. 3]|nr:MAG: hypothetical protein DRQ99_14755 [Gammaproteobacteria bacterium]
MNSFLEKSDLLRSDTHFGLPKKRNYFARRFIIGILAVLVLGSIMPTVNFAEEPTEPTEPAESTEARVPTEPEYAVHGTITDTDGNALADVTVQVGDKTAVTDEEGIWEITGLSEGEYTLVASQENYAFSPKEVTLSGEQSSTEVALEIVPAIFGTILDLFGNPIAGVTVEVADKTAVTDEDGIWEIIELSEGD